jgi:cation diffusion facilitator family transporter
MAQTPHKSKEHSVFAPLTPGEQAKRNIARAAIISNASLTVMKLVVAAVSGSVSVLAETVNSAGDLVGSAVAFGALRVAAEPPDATHAYGHGKFENLSGVALSLLLVGGAFYTSVEAIVHLIERKPVTYTLWAIVVMTLSAIANIVISTRMIKVGKEQDSAALTADGKHLQTDVYTALGAMFGLLASHFTHYFWIDPVVALGISVFVFKIGGRIALDAVFTLSDMSLPADEETKLRAVLDSEPGVKSYHRLRTRKSGPIRHVDVHVLIDDQTSFVDAHDYSEELEDKLRDALPNVDATIHMEPFEAETRHQREVHGKE